MIAVGFTMSFLVMLADITLTTLNTSLIFNRLGPEYYSYMNLVKAASLMAFSLLISKFKTSREKSLLLFVFAIAVMILAGAILHHQNLSTGVYFFVAAEGALLVGFNFAIWPVHNGRFPGLIKKRAFPVISAGYSAAGVLAGLMLASSLRSFPTDHLAYYALGIVCVLFAFSMVTLKNGRKPGSKIAPANSVQPGAASDTRLSALLNPVSKRFVLALLGYHLFSWLVYRFVDYKFDSMLLNYAANEQEFAFWLSLSYTALNLIVIFYQIVAAPFLLTHIGLTRLLVAFPLFILISSTSNLFLDLPALTALNSCAAELNLCAIAFGAIALVYNVIENKAGSKVQVLVEGAGCGLGTALSSLFIILLNLRPGMKTSVPELEIVLVIVSLFGVVMGFVTSRTYISLALRNLDNSDQDVFLNSLQALQEPGRKDAIGKLVEISKNAAQKYDNLASTTAARALSQLSHKSMPEHFIKNMMSDLPQGCLFALSMLDAYYCNEIRTKPLLNHKIVQTLERLIVDTAKDSDSMSMVHDQAVMLYLKVAPSEKILKFLESALSSNSSRLIANTIEGIAILKDYYAKLFIESFIDHEDNRIRSTALVEMWKLAETADEKQSILRRLAEMASSPVIKIRRSGIWAIGRIRDPEALRLLSSATRELQDVNTKRLISFTLLRYSRRDISRHLAPEGDSFNSMYRMIVDGLLTQDRESQLQSLHFFKQLNRSHFKHLEEILIYCTAEQVGRFYHALLEVDPDSRFVRTLERLLSSSGTFFTHVESGPTTSQANSRLKSA